MKKVFLGILLIVSMLTINVKAANYEFKELMPVDIKTTMVTNNFSYRNFGYDTTTDSVTFEHIKNLSDKELPISISIAFFDENKRNLGVMNFCSKDDMLNSKEEKEYSIKIEKQDVAEGKNVKDIKYIAIITDNINCNTERYFDYVGYTVDYIGMPKNNTLDEKTNRLILVMSIVGGVLLILFLYNFLFTNAYQNMDGDDVRIGYRKYNKQLAKERKEELKRNPPKPKEFTKVKTDEVIAQEERAKNEDKSGTDLHNLYKK